MSTPLYGIYQGYARSCWVISQVIFQRPLRWGFQNMTASPVNPHQESADPNVKHEPKVKPLYGFVLVLTSYLRVAVQVRLTVPYHKLSATPLSLNRLNTSLPTLTLKITRASKVHDRMSMNFSSDQNFRRSEKLKKWTIVAINKIICSE